MQLCGVCSEHVPKYRCPACRIRYCSVGCFKRHKDDAEQPWIVEDLLDEDSHTDKVPLQKLQQLGDSEALKDLLRNPHLRQLMMSVDSAGNKAKAMKDAMQEPLFVEFADQCLKIIEPTQTDSVDEEY
ncbi:hypothetical protein PO909_026666 [Leuciscus waleckii]